MRASAPLLRDSAACLHPVGNVEAETERPVRSSAATVSHSGAREHEVDKDEPVVRSWWLPPNAEQPIDGFGQG
uniref:Uncharacterized protein n=1 Tax=Mycena chlorophos TaxID=658473 RepID=A0ABQ0LW49_MYCCL|nr:predicted protein [Mycena chlorophos]